MIDGRAAGTMTATTPLRREEPVMRGVRTAADERGPNGV
jgi:hypothetical protein